MQRRTAFILPLVAALALGASSVPARASLMPDPSAPSQPYVPWSYPPQLPWGAIEDGHDPADPPGGFLTLPFVGPHYVTSLFDHCHPDYVPDGRVCRFDGAVATRSKGSDPLFSSGYAARSGQKDYLYYDGHDGIDFGLYYEPVLAAAPGVVTAAGWFTTGCPRCEFGQQVVVDHGNGFSTRYGHLSQILAAVGQTVARGQVIGISGDTGASSGPHLHFGVYRTSGMIPIDPYGWQGSGTDPWPYDAGDLWLGGAPHFPAVPHPAVTASAGSTPGHPLQIVVSWSDGVPASTFDVSVVDGDQAATPWLGEVTGQQATYQAQPGHSYWFLVTAKDPLGWEATGMTQVVVAPRRGPAA